MIKLFDDYSGDLGEDVRAGVFRLSDGYYANAWGDAAEAMFAGRMPDKPPYSSEEGGWERHNCRAVAQLAHMDLQRIASIIYKSMSLHREGRK